MRDYNLKLKGKTLEKNQQKTDLMNAIKFMICQELIFPYHFLNLMNVFCRVKKSECYQNPALLNRHVQASHFLPPGICDLIKLWRAEKPMLSKNVCISLIKIL